jgi:hypothetical protein
VLGWLGEELDQGQGDQQQHGQQQDGLAGRLAPEHQRQRGQGDGADAQELLVGVDPGPLPGRSASRTYKFILCE